MGSYEIYKKLSGAFYSFYVVIRKLAYLLSSKFYHSSQPPVISDRDINDLRLKEEIDNNLNRAFNSFFVRSRKLANRLSFKFDHSSQPPVISDRDINDLRLMVNACIQDSVESLSNMSPLSNTSTIAIQKLRDLQHDAEDVIEEMKFLSHQNFMLEKLYPRLLGSQKQEVHLLSSHVDPEGFQEKINTITKSFKETRKNLSLGQRNDGKMDSCKIQLTIADTSGELYGRQYELKELYGYISPSSSYRVVSVVGMSGIGKTALLQHLCKEQRVTTYYGPPIWICASDGFDVRKITIEIIQHFKPEADITNQKNLGLLRNVLVSCLSGKCVLLVIDDVWIGNGRLTDLTGSWGKLMDCFKKAGEGSKVLFATQDSNIATILNSEYSLTLSGLSDSYSWDICKESGLVITKPKKCFDVNSTDGIKIAKMCKGLPLVANVVGKFLKRATDEQYEKLLQNENIWWGTDQLTQGEILGPLKRSYYRLPPYLKQCFAYCSLFPEGHIFKKEYMAQLWVGQGFIKNDDHIVGREYFDELVRRCFFQSAKNPDAEFMMNGFLHELARYISDQGVYLRINVYKLLPHIQEERRYGLPEIDAQVRHLSLVQPKSESVSCFLDGKSYLWWTFLYIGKPQDSSRINVSNQLFSLINSLRVLDLSHANLKELPSSVIYLIHLRYLSLAYNEIKKLPESMFGLFNLRTLDLKHCSSLDELPQAIKLLTNLQNLELPKSTNWTDRIPDEFEKKENCCEACQKLVWKGANNL